MNLQMTSGELLDTRKLYKSYEGILNQLQHLRYYIVYGYRAYLFLVLCSIFKTEFKTGGLKKKDEFTWNLILSVNSRWLSVVYFFSKQLNLPKEYNLSSNEHGIVVCRLSSFCRSSINTCRTPVTKETTIYNDILKIISTFTGYIIYLLFAFLYCVGVFKAMRVKFLYQKETVGAFDWVEHTTDPTPSQTRFPLPNALPLMFKISSS